MRRMTLRGVPRAWAAALASVAIVAFAAGCGPGDDELPDAGDSGTSGTPTGADSTPPRTVEESLPPDDSLTRPERRPVRTIPPLTRPDSGRS